MAMRNLLLPDQSTNSPALGLAGQPIDSLQLYMPKAF